MPITLKYGNPAGVLMTAYASGLNKSRERQADRLQDVWQKQQQRQFETQKAFQQYHWNSQLQQARLTHAAGQQQNYLDSQSAMQDKRIQANTATNNDRIQADIDMHYMDGVRSGDLELSPHARRRIEELDNADAHMAVDTYMSDDDRAAWQLKSQAERRALMRTAKTPSRKNLPPAERWDKSTVLIDPDTMQPVRDGRRGIPMTFDKNGNLTGIRQFPYRDVIEDWKLKEQGGMDEAQRQKLRKEQDAEARRDLAEARNRLEKIKTDAPPSDEEIYAKAAEIRRQREEYMRQQYGGQEVLTERATGHVTFRDMNSSAAQAGLPRPQSAEDVGKLPRGARFVAPDGSIRVNSSTNQDSNSKTLEGSYRNDVYRVGQHEPTAGPMVVNETYRPFIPDPKEDFDPSSYVVQAESIIRQAVENPARLQYPQFREQYRRAKSIYGTGRKK